MKLDAKKIYNILIDKNINNKEFCKRANMQECSFYSALRSNNVRYKTVAIIARALEVDEGEILMKEAKQKIKIIVTDKEKEYLCNVIKPLDIQVTEIRKVNYDDEWEQLIIEYENKLGEPYDIVMPIFDKGTMYKGMKTNIGYAPEELGL